MCPFQVQTAQLLYTALSCSPANTFLLVAHGCAYCLLAAATTPAGVLLLAATNRADALDPALLRPGRISRRVVVPLPDEAGRAAILGVHLRPVEVEGGEGAKAELARQLAAITPGFSGAHERPERLRGRHRVRACCRAACAHAPDARQLHRPAPTPLPSALRPSLNLLSLAGVQALSWPTL